MQAHLAGGTLMGSVGTGLSLTGFRNGEEEGDSEELQRHHPPQPLLGRPDAAVVPRVNLNSNREARFVYGINSVHQERETVRD